MVKTYFSEKTGYLFFRIIILPILTPDYGIPQILFFGIFPSSKIWSSKRFFLFLPILTAIFLLNGWLDGIVRLRIIPVAGPDS